MIFVTVIFMSVAGATAEGLPEDSAPTCSRTREEVFGQARRLHRAEEDLAEADSKDQQAQAKATKVRLRLNYIS